MGGEKWPGRLERLKGASSSVRRLLFSLWGGGTFNNLHSLIWSNGPWIDKINQGLGAGFDAEGFVYPGAGIKYGANTPQLTEAFFAGLRPLNANGDPMPLWGGFLWKYDEIAATGYSPAEFANAIRKGISV